MESSSAFYSGILMTTLLVVAFSTSCPRVITCPCGSSSQNYTQCLDDGSNRIHMCETWLQCQTCRDNTTHCITCPPKRVGPDCREDRKELIRRKRQSVTCPAPGSIPNGYRRLTKRVSSRSRTFNPGQAFRYFCNEGFVLQGNKVLTCLTSGTWSSSSPRCSEIAPTLYCPDPGQIPNGAYRNSAGNSATSQPYAVGDSVIYYCSYGYELDGSREITCMSSGSWPSKPSCRRPSMNTITTARQPQSGTRNCPDPGSIENGYRRATNGVSSTSQSFGPGISLRYFCNQGYRLQGENVLTCFASGAWSGSIPWCSATGGPVTPVDNRICPNPAVDRNGEIETVSPNDGQIGQGFKVGSQVTFRCRIGYDLYGTNPIYCRDNRRWSDNPPTCRGVSSTDGMCADPGSITHGGVIVYKRNSIGGRQNAGQSTSKTEHPVGTRLSYDCTSGYRLDGEKVITCISTGRWSGEKPRCIEDCGLSLLSTGGKITNGKNTTAGEFPWVVFIHINPTQSYCGGVMMDHRTVLSAAHCFEGADSCTLYFGKFNRSDAKDDQYVQTRRSSEVIVHSEFDIETFNNDIAIIKFSREVQYTDRIQPICMPTPSSTAANVVPNELGFLTGWGLNENQVMSPRLMLANLPVQTTDTCLLAYQRRNLLVRMTSGKYCAGFKEHADLSRIINACRGDSGSPMVFYNNQTERFTVEGLVSHGISGNCDQPEKYTMFTKVSNYLRWIFQNT